MYHLYCRVVVLLLIHLCSLFFPPIYIYIFCSSETQMSGKKPLRQKAELWLNCKGTKRVYNSIWCLFLILRRKSPAVSGVNLAQVRPTFGPDWLDWHQIHSSEVLFGKEKHSELD